MGCAAAVDRTRDRVSTSWWADGRAFIGGTARAFRPCHQAELFGRIVRVHGRGPRLAPSHTLKAGQDMSSHTRATGSLPWVGVSHRTLMAWRLLSAIMLLVMGGIHLYLVFDGVGGSLGVLFVLNAVGALVLAIAIIVLRGRLLSLAIGLSLLFMVGTSLKLNTS